jgi:hypothetical protein
MAQSGALAGAAVAPWLSGCSDPTIAARKHAVQFQFDACRLDERATHCLICLLLVLNEEISIERVAISAPRHEQRAVSYDPQQTDPYPDLWPDLPFRHSIEESESEDMVLRAQFATSLTDKQVANASDALMGWGRGAAAGAYGIPSIDPGSCGFVPGNPVEHFEGEVTWALEKCRFHPAALMALISVCGAIHHRIAPIVEVVVE